MGRGTEPATGPVATRPPGSLRRAKLRTALVLAGIATFFFGWVILNRVLHG